MINETSLLLSVKLVLYFFGVYMVYIFYILVYIFRFNVVLYNSSILDWCCDILFI